MKYIITNKDNIIIAISNTYERDEEFRNIKLDDYAIAYAPDEIINAYEVESVAEEITEQKYCYTEERGFYTNPNYVEPEPTEEDKIKDLQDQITELQLALAELAEGGIA